MKDPNEYCTLYHLGNKTLMAHKDECHYSVVLEQDDGYIEVIVPTEALDIAMKLPDADSISWASQLKLLFGNYDGFEYFTKFCDENYIQTKTFFWEK